MNTCPWRENRPGLIIRDPRPALEESLASVIIGKWCNTRALVSGHTGHCPEPHNETGLTILCSSNSMSLERKKRRRRKRRSVSQTSLNESGSSGSSGQSISGLLLKKLREFTEIHNVSRRKSGQPEILNHKPGDIAPRA